MESAIWSGIGAFVTCTSLMNSAGIWSLCAPRSPWVLKPEKAPVERTPSTFSALNSTGVPRILMPTTSPFSNSPATPGSRTMRLPMLPSATAPKASVETTFTTLAAVRWRVIDAASPSRELETVNASSCWIPPVARATLASTRSPDRTTTRRVSRSRPV